MLPKGPAREQREVREATSSKKEKAIQRKGEKIMAHLYKREGSEFWSYEFYFKGQRVRKCTDQTNRDAALDIMAAHRTKLAKGEAGFRERKRVALADFLKNDFLPFVKSKF